METQSGLAYELVTVTQSGLAYELVLLTSTLIVHSFPCFFCYLSSSEEPFLSV